MNDLILNFKHYKRIIKNSIDFYNIDLTEEKKDLKDSIIRLTLKTYDTHKTITN